MRRQSLLFDRWPRFAARHPRKVVGGALAVLVGFAVLFVFAGAGFADSFSIPGTESQRLVDLLEERFPGRAGDVATVVVRAEDGFETAEARSRVEALIAGLEGLPDVAGVPSPFDVPGTISPDGTIALIITQYEKQGFDLEGSSVDALTDLRDEFSSDELQVEVGGSVVEPQSKSRRAAPS